MQQPVEHENDMEGEENVTSTQETPNETPEKSKTTDEVDDEDSSLGATLGLILVAILVCVGIGVGVYFGVAAILNSVKQNRVLPPGNNTESSTNETVPVEETPILTTTSSSPPTTTTSTTTTTKPPNRLSQNLYHCDLSTVKLRRNNWNWQVRLVNEPITTNETEVYYPKHDRDAVRHTNANTVCSGTILSNFTVLTSAECCSNLNLTETTVYAGNDYDAYYERRIVSFKIHENFERGLDDDHANENDLCLLEMDKNILFSSGEQLDTDAICLPTFGTKHLPAETKCFAGGYGSLKIDYDPNRAGYRVFDETELSLLTDRDCRRTGQSSSGFKYGKMFCANFERLEDACILDVGSPLICVQDNRPYLYGFVSHSYQCGEPNFPGIFAKVTSYLEWIDSNLFGLNVENADNSTLTEI